MSIRLATFDDIPALAQIHFESLPDDFLPSLGLDFLQFVYYPAGLRSNQAATFVAEQDGTVVGFVTVALDSDAYTRDVLHGNYLKMGFYALRTALRRPSHLLSSIEVLYAAVFAPSDSVKGEIVFIAVQASYRGRGIGKKLIGMAMEYLIEKSVLPCRTKTLVKNRDVIRFYEELGWHVRNQISLLGNQYAILVSPDGRLK